MPLPVSTEGWEFSAPPEDGFRAIYVTPSCQSPLGVTMRLEQRLRLADIARAQGGLDHRRRFRRRVPLFRERRASAARRNGGQSNHLCRDLFQNHVPQALGMGYVILPLNIVANISQAMYLTGQYASGILQAALADFIEEGHFTTHLGRMRRGCKKRRETAWSHGNQARRIALASFHQFRHSVALVLPFGARRCRDHPASTRKRRGRDAAFAALSAGPAAPRIDPRLYRT